MTRPSCENDACSWSHSTEDCPLNRIEALQALLKSAEQELTSVRENWAIDARQVGELRAEIEVQRRRLKSAEEVVEALSNERERHHKIHCPVGFKDMEFCSGPCKDMSKALARHAEGRKG